MARYLFLTALLMGCTPGEIPEDKFASTSAALFCKRRREVERGTYLASS